MYDEKGRYNLVCRLITACTGSVLPQLLLDGLPSLASVYWTDNPSFKVCDEYACGGCIE